MPMKNIALGTFFALTFAFATSVEQDVNASSQTIEPVDYCALRKNPERYNGKEIRVSGVYVRGDEMSAFYSPVCVDDPYRKRYETWVDKFYGAKRGSDQDTAAIVSTFLTGKAGDELEVTLTAVFRSRQDGGGFGHLGASKYQIEVLSIEKAKLLPEQVAGCRRIDQTKPFHYLAYEKMAKGTPPRYEPSVQPKSEDLIYLRLANNSTCSIKVPTVELPDSDDLWDKSEVPVIYDLDSPCVRVSGRSITQARKTLSPLPPGKSIYLAVPLRFLTTEPYEIRIPFDSGTVKDSSFYQPFYFSRYDLPKDLRKDLDCRKY